LGECVPCQDGALDTDRELHHTLESLEITERRALEMLVVDMILDRHHVLEAMDDCASLVDWSADNGLGHHRRRTLRDRATLPRRLHIAHDAIGNQEVQRDLVAAQRIVALDNGRRRRLDLPTVTRIAIVVEDDLSVEVVESRHVSSFAQNPKMSLAPARPSHRASTSLRSL